MTCHNNLLIGNTGFVGSNLDHKKYDIFINSKNYKDIKYKTFNNVVCAGFSGTKYLANNNPKEDWEKIKNLLDVLLTIQCNYFRLISTIDIYYDHPYGKHRAKAEEILLSKFSNIKIFRLPGIYGNNLKKNAIYDLINNNNLNMISLEDEYQWYCLSDLENDINKNYIVDTIELFTEPISIDEINDNLFHYEKNVFSQQPSTKHYNFRPYIYDKSQVLNKLRTFIKDFK